jgi:hypothetical protein
VVELGHLKDASHQAEDSAAEPVWPWTDRNGSCSATFAANEVHGISEDKALTVDVQCLPHEIVLLKMQVANRQQTLKSRPDPLLP